MGRHLKAKRKAYKRRRKQNIKEKLRDHIDTNEDPTETENEGDIGPAKEGSNSRASVDDGKDHFKKDILYTSMIRLMKFRKKYCSMKQIFDNNQDILLLDPDQDRRTKW